MHDGLKELADKNDLIVEIRGKGLLLAVKFREDIAEQIMLACLEKGFLVNNVKPDALRLMPPLIVTAKGHRQGAGYNR